MNNVETVPNLCANPESHQERPPKSVLEPPKRSRHDPTYVECLNHPKQSVEEHQHQWQQHQMSQQHQHLQKREEGEQHQKMHLQDAKDQRYTFISSLFQHCHDSLSFSIVLNTMVTIFSKYCERKFEIEPVEVIYSDGKSYIYPDLSVYNMEVSPLSCSFLESKICTFKNLHFLVFCLLERQI